MDFSSDFFPHETFTTHRKKLKTNNFNRFRVIQTSEKNLISLKKMNKIP